MSFSKTRNSKQVIIISSWEDLEDEGRSEGKVFSLLMDSENQDFQKQLSLTRTIFNLIIFL